MTAYQTRLLERAEYRPANVLSRISLHRQPVGDEDWKLYEPSYEPGRSYGAFHDGELVGCTQSYTSELAVPGGKVVPAALVSRVGVRADHTRRGVLTGLMRAQLENLTEPLAALHASEAVIYGRFGYGMASRGRNLAITRGKATLRPDAPAGGRVRLLAPGELWRVLPDIYTAIGPKHAGWIHRPGHLWDSYQVWYKVNSAHPLAVVHTGPNGDDGFAIYDVRKVGEFVTLEVAEWFAADTRAWAGLLRYLLSVDLVDEIKIWNRPLDEPLEWLLSDYRTVRTEAVEDDTWLRLVKVEEALAARTYPGHGSVVLDVRDEFLPANSGRYAISASGVTRTDATAQLSLPVDLLAALYLGDVAPSAVAKAGRITVLDAESLPVADALFATSAAPWMATGF